MSNDLETDEVTAEQSGKEESITSALGQLAGAINGFYVADVTAGDVTITTAQALWKALVTIIGATTPGRIVNWPQKQRIAFVYSDPDNTQSVDLVRGSTVATLIPGTYYQVISDGTANGLEVLPMASISGGGGFVNKAGDVMTGPLELPDGTAADPSLAIGSDDKGFYENGANEIGVTIAGTFVGKITAGGFYLERKGSSSDDVIFEVHSQGNAVFRLARYVADTTAPSFQRRKSRGSIVSPGAVVSGDTLGNDFWQGYTGAGYTVGGQLTVVVTEVTPTSSAFGTRLLAYLPPIGSGSISEIFRFDHATGFSMFASAPSIDQSRHHRYRSYTNATIPSVGAAGSVIFISDRKSGVFLVSDGSAWREYLSLSGGGTLTAVLQFPAGAANAPSVAVGEATTGFYQPTAGKLGTSISGVEVTRLTSTGLAIGSGFDPSDTLHVRKTGATTNRLVVDGEAGVAIRAQRYEASASAAAMQFRKSRGSIASPAFPNQNDEVGVMQMQGWDGTNFFNAVEIVGYATAATPSTTARDARLLFTLGVAGANTELFRFEHATGVSMMGANVVIDQDRLHTVRQYTDAAKPSASGRTGKLIYVTDVAGGVLCRSDGTDWVIANESLSFALSDETSIITTGTAKLTYRMPYKGKIIGLPKSQLNTVSSSGLPTVDINKSGSTILSTKLTIDASEKTSVTAATPAVVSDATFVEDDEFTFDIDVAGTGAKGLKVILLVKRIL